MSSYFFSGKIPLIQKGEKDKCACFYLQPLFKTINQLLYGLGHWAHVMPYS